MHLHQLTLKRLRAKRQTFDPSKARKARVALLRELAKVKTPAQRRQRQQAAEKGSLQKSRKRLAKTTAIKPRAQEGHNFNGDTPDEYSSVDV